CSQWPARRFPLHWRSLSRRSLPAPAAITPPKALVLQQSMGTQQRGTRSSTARNVSRRPTSQLAQVSQLLAPTLTNGVNSPRWANSGSRAVMASDEVKPSYRTIMSPISSQSVATQGFWRGYFRSLSSCGVLWWHGRALAYFLRSLSLPRSL